MLTVLIAGFVVAPDIVDVAVLVVVAVVVICLLLLSLAAVTGHSACKRAEGLKLMLDLQDWNSHEWNDKDQHKGMSKISKHSSIYMYIYIYNFKFKYCKQHIQQATLANTQQTLEENSISHTISTSTTASKNAMYVHNDRYPSVRSHTVHTRLLVIRSMLMM